MTISQGPRTPQPKSEKTLRPVEPQASNAACCEHCPRAASAALGVELASYLTPDQLADLLRGTVNVRTLANWRCERLGPRYIKVGRTVLYPPDAVQAWLVELHDRAENEWRDVA